MPPLLPQFLYLEHPDRVQEWQFLLALRHDAVLPCKHAFEVPSPATTRRAFCMVTPLCDANLCDAIKAKWAGTAFADGFIPAQRVALAVQLCSGLAYLHASHVAHRDIKPQKVLLQGRKLLIADLGLSKELDPSVASARHTRVGTFAYSVR